MADLLQLLEELESIDVGQADVEHRQCEGAGPHRFNRSAAGRAPLRLEAVGAKRVDDRVRDSGFILDHQNALTRHARRSAYATISGSVTCGSRPATIVRLRPAFFACSSA